MKVYTKTGDKGETSLIGGVRVKKYDLRIEAYGTVDELNSFVGIIRDQEIKEEYYNQLIEIQDRLFTIGSILASVPNSKMKLPELEEKDITFLEEAMDKMDEELEPMRSFILPGGHTTVSHTHIARCVCRRAERNTIALAEEAEVSPLVIQYLNRLSDYLFVLSRKLTKDLNAKEIPWKPRM
ncbi:cob(I)yrinic acid a,c-diamide adenosyltransferase [Lishizhenia sp.]|uniref:cob(I)yrinic acid a,c-diamide adenosyltransferase n=1 Tax=Lishizhenia sp. TaxID=2497594 RepID=UPI00299F26B5|nr:cob(I)yrinic acid a,c-diamide adenosyltransferase [Lishizhenia sp.]MDX1445034.1 cob(I)yrinic acid a,c-diamide adenosyltransferase [Lishizhenia sp.]